MSEEPTWMLKTSLIPDLADHIEAAAESAAEEARAIICETYDRYLDERWVSAREFMREYAERAWGQSWDAYWREWDEAQEASDE